MNIYKQVADFECNFYCPTGEFMNVNKCGGHWRNSIYGVEMGGGGSRKVCTACHSCIHVLEVYLCNICSRGTCFTFGKPYTFWWNSPCRNTDGNPFPVVKQLFHYSHLICDGAEQFQSDDLCLSIHHSLGKSCPYHKLVNDG